ncbi:MAG TPA: ABC transporter ATP-binding protein [Candidatus Cybelea sp.]|nr:ABC transporter ATP-binding protein [Candidatus Cybelea sp.]
MSERGGERLGLRNIVRTFVQAGTRLEVLRGASLGVSSGEVVALLGPSGSGKSTLLHIAGLLEKPDGGEVLVDGEPCGRMNDFQRTLVRRRGVGFVYQFHHLLPEFSALENVMLPQLIAGRGRATAKKRAGELLDSLGLAARADHRPARLSGGEQQRVAIARAVANDPHVLLADEPTGNLDMRTAETVCAALLHLVRDRGVAALIATHNAELAQRMDQRVLLQDGVLIAA